MFSDPLSDTELWEAIVKDDPIAFSMFFNKHWSKIYTTAYFYIKDEDTCAEIAHDIFLNIWLKRKKLKIVCFTAYLRSAARYHVYKHIKTSKLAPLNYVGNLESFSINSSKNTGETNIEYLELENRIDIYINMLPKRCRDIFVLSRKKQLSNEQIALKLNISKRTVENQLTHALHHLRTSLKDILMFIILVLSFLVHL